MMLSHSHAENAYLFLLLQLILDDYQALKLSSRQQG